MSKLGDEIKKIHKELDDMTPAENLVVAEDIIDDLHIINGSLRADNAKLRGDLRILGGSLSKIRKERTELHDEIYKLLVLNIGLCKSLEMYGPPVKENDDG